VWWRPLTRGYLHVIEQSKSILSGNKSMKVIREHSGFSWEIG
jgi:hypothetical protein